MSAKEKRSETVVAFLHPDLGIGGAERAVIDMAIAVQQLGYRVEVLTSHHDPNRCFEETSDGTLRVTARGDFLPRSVFGRFIAMCAYIRMLYLAFWLTCISGIKPDVVVCDQVPIAIPLIKWLSRRTRILFYCHFPDLLLTERKSFLKIIYRAPIDRIEENSITKADLICVNSEFTKNVVRNTFTSLRDRELDLLYPVPDTSQLDKATTGTEDIEVNVASYWPAGRCVFLTLNRYERKKNLALAVEAIAELHRSLASERNDTLPSLIVAGGYDERLPENITVHAELVQLAHRLGVQDHVLLLRNVSTGEKAHLLSRCAALLYTPSNEHFGIVPLEAMHLGCPVIACASGGPLETVRESVTGYLREPNPKAFADAMKLFVGEKGTQLRAQLGAAGRKHVAERFSFARSRADLERLLDRLVDHRSDKKTE